MNNWKESFSEKVLDEGYELFKKDGISDLTKIDDTYVSEFKENNETYKAKIIIIDSQPFRMRLS